MEEKVLGIIQTAKINTAHCEIQFVTEDNLNINGMVKIVLNNTLHYFTISDISATVKDHRLFITAHEIGYYNRFSRKGSFDLRDLFNLEVLLVTDEKEIRTINNQSGLL